MKNRIKTMMLNSTVALGCMGIGLHIQAQTVQPHFTVAQAAKWLTYSEPAFSFQYPASWKLQTAPGGSEAWAQDDAGHAVGVRFIAGAPNRADTFNQCASEDQLLEHIYKTEYEPLQNNVGRYPNTTVTHDDFMPGMLGGRETWITVVHTEAYQKPVSLEVWINVIPRAGGIYVIAYRHPSEPMQLSEPLRKAFAQSVQFVSGPLDKNAYCNYLGH